MCSGNKIWAYDRFKLIPGFPKKSNDPRYPINPHTAIYKNKTFYLVKVIKIILKCTAINQAFKF